ncbi:MAG: hypothetical protein GON13_00065 [Nanoarchaeota archaeon]|nr:hypothetical protein [Nanoarchaeota archaeon]
MLVGILIVSIATAIPTKEECRDKLDNDGDGYIDLLDGGCDNKFDNDETDCGDGVCEGGETSISCSQDCGQPDSCTDTDGGFNILLRGTAYGVENGIDYYYTDSCLSDTTLLEYYCNGVDCVNNVVNCYDYNLTLCFNGTCG